MSESEMQAELERLRAENAHLKSKDKGGLTLKVTGLLSSLHERSLAYAASHAATCLE
jgi:hypothetical protein